MGEGWRQGNFFPTHLGWALCLYRMRTGSGTRPTEPGRQERVRWGEGRGGVDGGRGHGVDRRAPEARMPPPEKCDQKLVVPHLGVVSVQAGIVAILVPCLQGQMRVALKALDGADQPIPAPEPRRGRRVPTGGQRRGWGRTAPPPGPARAGAGVHHPAGRDQKAPKLGVPAL